MDNFLTFLNEHYDTGPFVLDAELETNGQRKAYRLRSPGGYYVVKLTDPGRAEAVVQADVGTPAFLAAHGFPAPNPLPARDGRLYLPHEDRFVYIYDYIEGEHPMPRVDFYRRLGELLARLHSISPGVEVPESSYRPAETLHGVREALMQVDSFIGDAGELTPQEQRAIVPELVEMIDHFPSFETLPEGLIHSDPWLTNLVETPSGTLYLIDWEDGGVTYPLLDVGYVLSYMCTFTARDRRIWNIPGPENGPSWNPDWGKIFLEAYEAVRPLSAEEHRLLPDAIRLSFLSYIPNWGTTELILDNYRRMKLVLKT